MSSEAKQHEAQSYTQELVQVMKDYELIHPEEEEQLMAYLWNTQ